MKKIVDLPLLEPLYSTYHNQGPATAILVNNPSIRNWYLNKILTLICTRKFLNGFTTPEIGIAKSSWMNNPYLDRKSYDMSFLKGYTHCVIKNFLDAGYYVCFRGIDDFNVEGKSWHHQRHFPHDGCICGYNQYDKTYCIYAYDKSWIYRKFWTSKKSFDAGMKAMFKNGEYNSIYGLKPKTDYITFSPEMALANIESYLNSSFKKYPETEEGTVYGIIVHNYIAKYIEKLYEGAIPYEKTDRRVLRMIWEHKKVMLERIKLIEQELSLDNEISNAYLSIIKDADIARMLYAAHHIRRRDEVLPIISKKLISIKDQESVLLAALLAKGKGEIQK